MVEARSVADGSLRWSAPLDSTGYWLGSPPVAQSLNGDRALWPASAVIVRTPPKGERYEVRQLATGKVVARGVAGDEALGVVGNLFLRQTEKGVLTATDVTSGEEVWKRPADGLVVARAPDARCAGSACRTARCCPSRSSGTRRTSRSSTTSASSTRAPASSSTTNSGTCRAGAAERSRPTAPPSPPQRDAGFAPRVPVVWGSFERKVAADGRLYRTGKLGSRAVAATATQIAWDPDVHPFAGGERDGAVVYDRRSGKRVVHYAGEDDVFVRSEGERIVIRDNGREYVVKP